MHQKMAASQTLAVTLTQAGSPFTTAIIRWWVDRAYVGAAYRAYGYFRWVDDVLDGAAGTQAEKIAFAQRQRALLTACYHDATPQAGCAEEEMLVALVRAHPEKTSGLRAYLANMMAVMSFDAQRRGRVATQAELAEYSRRLAVAVTEALHYFIGHADPVPRCPGRYLAVTAAHITHMLRDTAADIAAGYFNIPAEYLHAQGLAPQAITQPAYRRWVYQRVQLARQYFNLGRAYLAQVKNWRCRWVGYVYTAHFEWILRTIEYDYYSLRSVYPAPAGLDKSRWIGWATLAALTGAHYAQPSSLKQHPTVQTEHNEP